MKNEQTTAAKEICQQYGNDSLRMMDILRAVHQTSLKAEHGGRNRSG